MADFQPQRPHEPLDDDPAAGEAAPVLDNVPFSGRAIYIFNYPLQPLNFHMDNDTLHRLSLYKTAYGTVLTVVGILAIIFPMATTLAIDLVIGSVLVVTGLAAIGAFLLLCGAPGSLLLLVLGLLHSLIGFFLLTRPAEAIVYITLVLSACFIAQGVLKMALAHSLRGVSSWPAVFISGLLSVGLGFWIVALLPENSEWVLGVLFGVDVLVTGVAALLVGLMTYLGKRPPGAESEPLLPDEEPPMPQPNPV